MLKIALVPIAMVLFSVPQDPPAMPKPVAEHEWLQQFVGEWESEAEFVDPGNPPVKSKGSETVRSIGGFWILGENRGEVMGTPFTGILTVGYDPEKKKFVGTWVDSMTSLLVKYEGSVDKDGKILTLEAEGPSPDGSGKLLKYRDVHEFKDQDHKVLTSSIQGEDGQWTTYLTVRYTRKNK